MDRFDPFVKYADVYGDIINWEKDPMNKPQNQNKYFFSDGKTYYEQICKMLRLMSVFKEAFNQIYSNEDEISEAWENFVNNLSASVVEGSEPDVTLTWTDDSVNFEFTMVPGVPGDPGVGITSISFNSDYTMTITLSDGSTYTSMSLKGDTGPQGPQGETGSGLQILDVYATLADLQSAHPTGQPGDAYQVGSGGSYTLYIWSSSQSAWVQAGTLGTVSPYTSAPLMDGTASAGSQNLYARGDHVHPSDTSRASKEELDALIKTSQSLIDQSFTYRESPAIQDGLARIDKIKGNTLVWNQLNTSTGASKTDKGITFTNLENGFFTIVGTATDDVYFDFKTERIDYKAGHKYAILGITAGTYNTYYFRIFGSNYNGSYIANVETDDYWTPRIYIKKDAVVNLKVAPAVYDLTLMFGAGKEPATVKDFTDLFPLPYYKYNAGSLLDFTGTKLKTTDKNLSDIGSILSTNTGYVNKSTSVLGYAIKGHTYTLSFKNLTTLTSNFKVRITPEGTSENIDQINKNLVASSKCTFTFTASDTGSVWLSGQVAGYTSVKVFEEVQLEYGSTASDYEPYEENEDELPISTFFPTGMKSAGTVYDELLPTKAITRIGAVDLGTLNWAYNPAYTMFLAELNGMSTSNKKSGACAVYEVISSWVSSEEWINGNMLLTLGGADNYIRIKNTSYTDANTFKSAMNGIYLYYELATPTETDVDLDFDFMAYENGTEQLLPVNGSVPSTSPIIADMKYLSIDDAMEYIIEKLANVPLNTQQILESLEDDVADLQTDVGALQPAVSALQTSVGNINTNIGQLSSTVAGHTSSISDMQSDIADLNTDLSDISGTVTDHTSRIGTLESGLSTTNGNVQNLETSVSDLDDTVTAQGTTVTALDDIISDISNNPVLSSLGSHELGFTVASAEVTLPANTGTMVTIPKPTIFPNNYTPLFIVGMSTGSYNVSICSIPHTFGNSNSVTCRVWNHGSQQTTQISIYILCMRQRQSQ